MAQPKTVEFWRGASPIDGAPVVALATGLMRPSENSKTGPMVQTFILRMDRRPVEAVVDGTDASVCGDCPMRPSAKPDVACYVNTGWLTQLWLSWSVGLIPKWAPARLGERAANISRPVRAGAYGGPDVVPTTVWDAIYAAQPKGTGYTHQWRTSDLQGHAMASVDNLEDASEAHKLGYRTYRVDLDGIGPQDGEIWCPEQTNGVECADCGLCAGTKIDAKNIVISPIN